jgi:predicted Zn-dependent protease
VLQATERLLDTYPDDPEAHLLRLHALVDHHNHRFTPESEALLRDGLRDLERVDPDNPNLEILRGMSREFYPERPAAALQERVEQCLARTDLSPALRAFALRASARHHLHVTEDADEALDCLEEASSLDPANAWTFCYLADTYYRVGRIPESIHAARIALALSPDNYSSELLAQPLGAAGRWAEAAEILGRFYAQERKQRSAGWYAFTLHRAGNPRPAYEVALEAEDIPTESPDEIISGALPLAAYWAAAGNPERAQRHLRTLCQHESMNIAADMVRLAPELAASPLCAAIIENCEAE